MNLRSLFRYFYTSNRVFRSFVVFCPLVVFLIVSLKRSGYVIQEKITEHGELKRDVRSAPQTTSFPLVDEFQLSWELRRFDNEDSRVVGFPADYKNVTEPKPSATKIIYLATAYFGKWNPLHFYFLHLGNATFMRYSCPVDSCFVTKNPSDIYRADAVLFHVRDLEVFSIPAYRSPDQIWILYSMEPPWLELKDMRRFDGLFNWTMSYRRTSDILVRYGFIGRKRETGGGDLLNGLFDRKLNRALWLVSNCNTDSNRERYVERLKKIYPVDIRGGCGRRACMPAETKKCYLKMASRYKFYLSFENAICEDYVTEKLFNSLEYSVIPVTLGAANYSNLTPRNSVINAMDFGSPEELGQFLWRISRNRSLYLSYFAWKDTYRSYLQPWMCDLCKVLHGPVSPKTNNDLERWWNGGTPCVRWTDTGFKRVEKHVFPKYHLKLFE